MDVRAQIVQQLQGEESLILLTDTDLGKDGRFGNRWLAITSERVLVYSENGVLHEPDLSLALKDVREMRTSHLVGQIALEAEIPSRRVEVLRGSNALTERFAKVAKGVTDAVKNGNAPVFHLDEEARVCHQCGRLLPERGSFCPICLKKHKVAQRLWGYMRPHWRKVFVASSCILAATSIELVPPYLMKTLVDDVLLGSGGVRLLVMLVAAMVVLRVAGTGLNVLQGRIMIWLSSRMIHDVRVDFYRAVQALSLRRYDKTQTGALMSRLTGDTTWLNFFFSDIGVLIAPQFLQITGICVMLLILNWQLALLVLIPTPVVVIVCLAFYRRLRGLYHRLWQRHARMSVHANDSISGIRVVKAFSQERKEISRFNARSSEFFGATAEADQLWATAFPIVAFTSTVGIFLVWYFGGQEVIHTHLSVGALMAFLGYLAMFYGPIQMLTHYMDHLNRALTAAQRLFEVMDAEQEVYEDSDAVPLENPQGAFEFKDVHFAYLKDSPVLKGFTAGVKPGEMIGLVGKSGAGKTTITNLISRFYDADEGSILLDGIELGKIRLRDLRRHIGVVPQDCFLFDGTILENIAYSRPGASRHDVIRVAIAANAHGFIMRLPDGYDTRVGERGTRLSGGEKQRIAIARAILHDPRILILDEATSAVDTETEELIQQALTRLVKNRTTFAIAHRLSTLRHASRILVLDEGKVAEYGTHDELLAKKGIYHRLVELQSKLSAVNAVDG